MRADHLEILVEERSMEAFLRELLPRMLPIETTFEIYTHLCKDDLLAKLPQRLKGYSTWLPGNYRIVVVVDRDDADCKKLKASMEGMATNAGLITRTAAVASPWQVANRIAIEELEAWFFGDWEAVTDVYSRVPKTISKQSKYRDPDAIAGGTWEALERVLRHAGYFKSGLPKIEVARALGKRINPVRNRSRSFQTFREALREATA